MSYGHANHLTHSGTEPDEWYPSDATMADKPGDIAVLAPDWYARPELAPVLISHNIGALFRWLSAAGLPQRRIAALISSTQPQVADIIAGRRTRVQSYDVLVRTAAGLRIPRERMGLSFWGPDGTWYGPPYAYPEGVATAHTPKGVTSAMLRRHLIAFGGTVMAGVPVPKLGEPLDALGTLPPVPLPSRLSHRDVVRVWDTTRRLAEAGNSCLCDPQTLSDAAARMTQLLDVPGTDQVKRPLMIAVAELRIEAGWAALDAGFYHHALHHFAHALELAIEAKDPYCQALALRYAGVASAEHGYPDDGLKMLQSAQVAAWKIPPDEERAVIVGEIGKAAVEAAGLANAATALALLGHPQTASTWLAQGRQLWTPTRTDPFGDLDRPAAQLEIQRGRLDIAEQLATASLRRWETGSQISRTLTGIVLATIHVKAGEQRGLQLAHRAIIDVTKLTSGRARKQLAPLAQALATRPGSDARELARMACHVAVI